MQHQPSQQPHQNQKYEGHRNVQETARRAIAQPLKGFGAEGFQWLRNSATGSFLNIPMPFVLLVLVGLLTGLMLHRSIYGRHLFAVGHNPEAARYSGINSSNIVTGAYVISGSLAGLAAILLA